MGDSVPDSKTPALAAIGLAVLGLAIAALKDSVGHGSFPGGIIALLGAIPACYGMWKGIQQETQTTLALSVAAVLVSLGVAGLLLVLAIIHLLH
jgi:hypothetical protein